MKARAIFRRMNSRLVMTLVAGIAASLLCSVPARADLLTLSLESPLTVNAGTSGHGFDVLLTNASGPAVFIAGFTFEILTASPDITFTDTNTATVLAPYIFGGNSLFGPAIMVTNTGQDLSASDLFIIPASDISLGSGATVALGHILFDVSSLAPSETVAITLAAFPATGLSDSQLNNIPISTLSGSQINIIGSGNAIPEPSSLILLLTGVPLVWVGRKAQRLPR
jgi:hypothetical protein